ncbi:MAG: DUF4367 domain-containing protein [Clostridia bacterium]|nr:DUF4367 domain-containing protein [Clostridia bacterium]
MLNTAERDQIIERLLNDPETEMTRYELEEILEAELEKPDVEIDAQLVQEVLSLLEEDMPTEDEQQDCWNQIERQLHVENRKLWYARARRIATCIVAAILVLMLTMGAAQAYNWTFLVKLLRPIAETFGIYSSNQENDNIVPSGVTSVYTQDEIETTQIQFDSLEDFPSERDGYRVLPEWMPERFAFVTGSLYEDEDMAVLAAYFRSENGYVNIDVTFLYDSDSVISFDYEKTLDEPIVETILDHELTYYYNMADEKLSASWVHEEVHYHVAGNLTVEELRQMVEGLLE